MNRHDLFIELNKSNFEFFHVGQYECHVRLDDDSEFMVQLSGGSISKKRMDLLKNILENYEKNITKAVQQLKAFDLDIGENYFLYGIFVGEFNFGSHGRYLFDGFTVSLKREDGTIQDKLNLGIYTVQFKADGWPLGVTLWFE
ncbi:hypothetical protein [Pseudoflavonifractor phocaeensis]|uniref:hypothetical protein n=1 Tax=Pseudoflavonifractor phocaeensis TaxID=1870988 RepID=UPI00195E0D4F|nr:hypothetical protein [Pseudoflavonifractor phocaeensis]MBM6725344.1 hypothetical protein [Pseudoflavonifractor phocaeensis]